MAEDRLGFSEEFAWFPAAVGFLLGALFVWAGDQFTSDDQLASFASIFKKQDDVEVEASFSSAALEDGATGLTRRKNKTESADNSKWDLHPADQQNQTENSLQQRKKRKMKIRRVLLLVVAITVHNFPEGMAVGFGFGAVPNVSQKGHRRMYEAAWNLAIGIGIQNFPEGFAVSVPLYREGMSKWNAFLAGQASGIVEPIAGLMGYFMVYTAQSLLPYALAFAAGAMIFVVCDDLLAEVHRDQVGHESSIASWGVMIGFTTMMVLDVSLG